MKNIEMTPEGGLSVYCLRNPEHCGDLTGWLSDDEHVRAARFRRERDRALFIGTHVFQRFCLWLATGKKQLRITAMASGKPILPDNALPFFNMSHCDGMVVCAVSAKSAVGVDVEKRIADAPADVQQLVFTSGERAWVKSDPERFLQVWTMKEALFKASGEAWSDRWKEISVLDALSRDGMADWTTQQADLEPDYLCAVAAHGAQKQAVNWVPLNAVDIRKS